MRSRSFVAAVCAAMLGTTAACATNSDPVQPQQDSASAATSAASSTQAGESDPVVVDVRIDGGSVTPTNERLEAVVGEPVTVRVDSDAVDELHVHSVPDHSFMIAAASDQSFEFVVDVPGSVSLELHDAGKTIATLLVRP